PAPSRHYGKDPVQHVRRCPGSGRHRGPARPSGEVGVRRPSEKRLERGYLGRAGCRRVLRRERGLFLSVPGARSGSKPKAGHSGREELIMSFGRALMILWLTMCVVPPAFARPLEQSRAMGKI